MKPTYSDAGKLAWYQRRPHPGGAAADHCGVSYAVLTCFPYISRGGCRFSASSPHLQKGCDFEYEIRILPEKTDGAGAQRAE